MNLSDIDRLILERQNRIADKLSRGIVAFEKEKVDPVRELKLELDRLYKRMRELEVLAFEGVTKEMENEAKSIQTRIQVITIELSNKNSV